MPSTAGSGGRFLLVPDDDPLLEVNDRLRNISGVVGDAFEVPRGAHQLEPGVELSGIMTERFLELVAELAILPIDRAVARNDGSCAYGVAAGQGVIAGAHLGEYVAGQRLELLGNRYTIGLLRQLARSPGNPGRQVGDPLPVTADLQHSRHAPQVRSDRLE